MAAPGCTVVFPRMLTADERRSFSSHLAPFGKVSPEWDKDDGLEIIGDPKEFGCDIEDAEAMVGLCLAGPEHAFHRLPEDAVLRMLGWRPVQIVNVGGINSGMYHQIFVGRVAIAIAERFGGLIHLGEIFPQGTESDQDLSDESEQRIERIRSELHPEDRDNPQALFKLAERPDSPLKPVFEELSAGFHRRVRERASRFPGRFWEIGDEEQDVSYLVDATFMGSWMRDPGFYML